MEKAISDVIAALLMLVVVIGLIGLTYSYIMGVFSSRTSQTFQVLDVYNDTITISNTGTSPITQLTGRISSPDEQPALLQVTPIDTSLVLYYHFDDSPEIVKSWVYPDYIDWSNNVTSVCGSWGLMGGFNNFGSGASTQTSLNLDAGDYQICFDWIKGDSWDGEYARFYFNGNLIWQKQYWGGSGTQVCGQTSSGWNELRENICVRVTHGGGTATLMFTSTLDQSASDEWWGVDNITIYKLKTKDNSGNNNDGSLFNGVAWVDGKFGKALSFDGVDDHVFVGDPPSLRLSKAITVCAWVKGTAKGKYYDFVGRGWSYLLRINIDGTTDFVIRDKADTKWVGTPIASKNGAPIDVLDGNWHFIVGKYDGAKLYIYVDYDYRGEIDYNEDIYDSAGQNVEIGFFYNYFNGIIDEVRIYNRALSAEEIKANYQSNVGAAIMPGQTASIKILNVPSKGRHTFRLCTSSQCQTLYLTIQ